jgi:diguanylate cyclase (GGDEF)-like protein
MSLGLRRLFAALPHVPAHAGAPGTGDEDDRSLLALIVETHRDITAAGSDVEAVMELVLARSQALTGADGAMVSLVEGDELLTRAASGISAGLVGRRRPLRETVARAAIDGRVPLLISDCETDPRINRELQKITGDKSLICVPLFQGEQVIGALNVLSSSETRLNERNRQTMEMVSVILSAAVSYAALVAQSELNEYQAVHDALTDLPNRTLFRQRIAQAAAGGEGEGGFAVVIMDLDRFKEVNDSMGHPAGDALLVEVARRVEGALRTSDMVARLGGDEFGLLLGAPTGTAGLETVLDLVREAIEAPIMFHDVPLAISASMGVAAYPEHGRDVETLLRHADVAMYAAKRSDLPFAVYDEADNRSDPSRLSLIAELRRGLRRHELVLHYQPKALLASGVVDSVEALVRWNHPERGLVFPDAFIPLAQETGLIRPLTRYVLEEAVRQARQWQLAGLELAVSVNLSARNLLDVEFPDQVERLLTEAGLPPALLELEITETTMLSEGARTKSALDRLSGLGIRISIDDFGTGYSSSLASLRRLPISEIKIDRSFIMNMDGCEDDAVIVRSTIDLGRNLGLSVVAEGVESEQVWSELRRLGCTSAQGYYLTRPVPADELQAWLAAREHERAA